MKHTPLLLGLVPAVLAIALASLSLTYQRSIEVRGDAAQSQEDDILFVECQRKADDVVKRHPDFFRLWSGGYESSEMILAATAYDRAKEAYEEAKAAYGEAQEFWKEAASSLADAKKIYATAQEECLHDDDPTACILDVESDLAEMQAAYDAAEKEMTVAKAARDTAKTKRSEARRYVTGRALRLYDVQLQGEQARETIDAVHSEEMQKCFGGADRNDLATEERNKLLQRQKGYCSMKSDIAKARLEAQITDVQEEIAEAEDDLAEATVVYDEAKEAKKAAYQLRFEARKAYRGRQAKCKKEADPASCLSKAEKMKTNAELTYNAAVQQAASAKAALSAAKKVPRPLQKKIKTLQNSLKGLSCPDSSQDEE